jgi:glutathione S-transferase
MMSENLPRDDPRQKARLAEEWLDSDFYRIVWKPTMQLNREIVRERMRSADPWIRYAWVEVDRVLDEIEVEWPKKWLEPLMDDEVIPEIDGIDLPDAVKPRVPYNL